jgi:hypothetical protein
MPSAGPPLSVRVLLVLLATWTVAREVQILWLDGLDGPWFSKPVYWTVILTASALCAARGLRRGAGERAPWLLIGAGGTAWSLADVHWTLVLADRATIPVPSVSDVGYLLFPPLVFAGLVTLVRARVRSAPSTLWVDGLSWGACWTPRAARPRRWRRTSRTPSATSSCSGWS